jgi:hypothetical protein
VMQNSIAVKRHRLSSCWPQSHNSFHLYFQPPAKLTRLGKIDPSSYSQPEFLKIEHVDLDWTVDFDNHVLLGSAVLHFKILAKSIETIVSF